MRVVLKARGHQMTYLTFALPRAADGEKRRAQRLPPKTLLYQRPDDHVHRAAFVLQRHEHRALGRAQTLMHGHQAAAAHEPAVGVRMERGCRHKLSFEQRFTQKRERVTSKREPHSAIVCEGGLRFARLGRAPGVPRVRE